ncbi:MAG: ABC transporter ATP-binding protein [Chloroflexota bacterium]|jgi:NitT/TauT family transport system ATP-binding protein
MPELLTAKNLWKVYQTGRGEQVMAIRDLNLSVGENEFVSLVGPSGCGKSTLLFMAAGLDEPSAGELHFGGAPVQGPSEKRGMVFQSYTLYPWLTVEENIRFALQKSNLSVSEQKARVEEFIALVGLRGFERAYPNQLSGGMRQRAAIARALVYRPQMLLMDEPFGALDSQTRRLMQELLLQVWETHRTTVLFVTHDIEEALLLSDRVYVMTARPGTIKSELRVNLPRPRVVEMETLPEFLAMRKHLLELIKEEVTLSG